MRILLPLYQRSIISNAFILTNEHMNWLGAINSKNIIDKINNSSFDAIVDLNQSHNQNFFIYSNGFNHTH